MSIIRTTLDKLGVGVDLPDKKDAILRGLQHEYARGAITDEQFEAAVDSALRGDEWSHIIGEVFGDDNEDCVVCGTHVLLMYFRGSGVRCPACDQRVPIQTLRARGIIREKPEKD